jgi:hypothetical protein
MALTKVTKSGITDNAIDADKIEDGTILDTDITPGTITNAKLAGSIANAKLANSSLTINGSSVSLGSSISAGALDWQAVITADGSTGTTGVAGRGYFIDTTSAAHTFTLPSSPTIGDTIAIVDYAGTFASNKLTIARNGNNIQGVANNSQLGTNRASVTLVYVDATKGWVYQNESNVADLQAALFITATGGTVTTSGDYKIHTFTGDGCFVVSQLGNGPTVPTGGPQTVSYLVVAGGGAGGGSPGITGGGGGAGGFREGRDIIPSYTASPLVAPTGLTITATTYPITVGAGGSTSSPNPTVGGSGSPSIFSTITSTSGGGGGGGGSPSPTNTGLPGGSGGGSGYIPANLVGSGNTPPVSPPQGTPGGQGYTAGADDRGGGGGGATTGGPGNIDPGTTALAGGIGATTFISGSPVTYSGGGEGGYRQGSCAGAGNTPSGGGQGGKGAGSPGVAGAGLVNRGGGGGGAAEPGKSNGAGGKGIVIIRYKFQ